MGAGAARIVQDFFAALLDGRPDEAFALLRDDVVWRYHGPAGALPFAGTFHGPSGVGQFFETSLGLIEIQAMDVQAIEEVGDVVFVSGRERSRIRASGAEYDVPWLHRVTIRDGKIAGYDEYLDTAAVVAALHAG